jgi:hypothetical protein
MITNRSLEKVKAILWEPTKEAKEFYSRPGTREVKRLLRMFVHSPWKDYNYIRNLDQSMLAWHKSFDLVNIRELHSFDIQKQPRVLSRIQHPNVATMHEIYWHKNKIFLVTEHLDISITQLQLQMYELDE